MRAVSIFCSAALLCCSSAVSAETIIVNLQALKDATLIQNPDQEMGSGASNAFYVGRVDSPGLGLRRRGLIQFDIAGPIPAGATITSVKLTLVMLQTTSGPQPVALHRALSEWSEGPSESPGGQGVPAQLGDCTWMHRDYPRTSWSANGGDYSPGASATTSVGDAGTYSWSTAAMTSNVQSWLDSPSTNFGWLVRGNENVQHTAKKFASRESEPFEIHPVLTVMYIACADADLNCDDHVDSADLGILLGAWGTDGADLDGDGVVDAADLSILLGAWTG